MRFFFYGARIDEYQHAQDWAKENGAIIEITDQILTPKSAHLAKGFDGISVVQIEYYSRELFATLNQMGAPPLSIRAAGIDNADLPAAREYKIKIANVPAYSPNAVAEFAICLMLQLLRKMPTINANNQRQDFRYDGLCGRELKSMTVGVVGTGLIGTAVINILQGFGSKIIAYSRSQKESLKNHVTYVDTLTELFQQADIIALHISGLEQNHHMINQESIQLMKDGAYLINVSRGVLVNTKDLIEGLNSGKIAGAGLDANEAEIIYSSYNFEGQELQDPYFKEILQREDVITTPHIAFYTDIAIENRVKHSLNNLKEIYETGYSINEL